MSEYLEIKKGFPISKKVYCILNNYQNFYEQMLQSLEESAKLLIGDNRLARECHIESTKQKIRLIKEITRDMHSWIDQ